MPPELESIPLDEAIVDRVLDPDPFEDPFALYERVRTEDPFHASPIGVRFVSTYQEAAAVLRSRAFGSDIRNWDLYESLAVHDGEELFFWKIAARQLLLLDPPEHTRLRSLVAKAFSNRVVEGMGDDIVELVEELIDGVDRTSPHEFTGTFCRPLPMTLVARMLGVPEQDQPHFSELSGELAKALDPMRMFLSPEVTVTSNEAAIAFAGYLEELITYRLDHLGDDLLSRLLVVEVDGRKLDRLELIAAVGLLLIAGLDTTRNLLGCAIVHLAADPELWTELAAGDDHQLEAFVEEIVRLDAPVQSTARVALEDSVLAGSAEVAKGDLIVVLNGSANRDPLAFQDADQIVLDRDGPQHLGFGLGAHFCIGAPLARREGVVSLRLLMDRFRGVELVEPVRWRESFSFRGPETLQVRFLERASA